MSWYEKVRHGNNFYVLKCFRDHNFHYLPTFLALNGYNGVKQRNPSPEIDSEEHLVYAEDFLKVFCFLFSYHTLLCTLHSLNLMFHRKCNTLVNV